MADKRLATPAHQAFVQAAVEGHLFYSEYGDDILDVDVEEDDTLGIIVFAFLRLEHPLNNHTDVEFIFHHAGDPVPPTHIDHVLTNRYKGEGLAIKRSGATGIRWAVNGHLTGVDPNPNKPVGERLTTIETDVLQDVFVR